MIWLHLVARFILLVMATANTLYVVSRIVTGTVTDATIGLGGFWWAAFWALGEIPIS